MNRYAKAWAWVVAMEPARVLAVWRALVVAAGTAGLILNPQIDALVIAAVGLLYAVVELITTASIRARVVPVAKMPPDLLDRVAAGPLPGSPGDAALHG